MGQGKGPMEDVDDDVNGWITLSFALAGIAFDLACMIEFYKSGKRSEAARSVNMFSALLHVGADFPAVVLDARHVVPHPWYQLRLRVPRRIYKCPDRRHHPWRRRRRLLQMGEDALCLSVQG